MSNYICAIQAAEKWKVSKRQVSKLCHDNRVEGAIMEKGKWLIPEDTEKPCKKIVVPCRKPIGNELKPFIKWAGGKTQLLSQIKKFIPKEDCTITKYVEPMVGGGALLFSVLTTHNFESLYISDINPELINCYKVIKNDVNGLIKILLDHQNSLFSLEKDQRRKYYYKVRDRFNTLELNDETATEKAGLFIFLNKTCFNGLYRVNKQGIFNVPMGDYKEPTICDKANLKNISKALQNVTIVCGDYAESKYFIDENTFVYLDPPYKPLSETTNFTSYTISKFNDEDQVRLAKFVREIDKTGARILLSNSDPKNIDDKDEYFEELYKGFNIKRVYANRVINSKSQSRGKITELLIYNK